MVKLPWLCLSSVLLLAELLPAACSMEPQDLHQADSWQSFAAQSSQSFASALKRHSEGTFSSDFSHYLDRMRAKDFVHWLISTKRYSSSSKRYLKEQPSSGPFPAAFPQL
ncbi:exendin-3-like [Dryobates pubescens]|uniref:exendin-3-like n=1 Tax=Dryobates pubescens TaxID=118200 RepID=UPI0023B8E227|nr:exendin-3-like [Dryobates pubescens]